MNAHPLSLADWLHRGGPALCLHPDGQILAQAALPAAVFPGSFNPLHDAHCRLADLASELIGQPVAFELSLDNVDKPSLPAEEIERRAVQFRGRAPLWLTRAPTFRQKADLFPGAVFVIGADTALRLVLPKYYRDSDQQLQSALDHIRQRGCRFLVAGRVNAEGHFLHLSDIAVPAAHADLFTGIPADRFRHDLSSTVLRGAG